MSLCPPEGDAEGSFQSVIVNKQLMDNKLGMSMLGKVAIFPPTYLTTHTGIIMLIKCRLRTRLILD